MKIPKNAKRRKDNHLAEGEVTGHFHLASGAGVAVLETETEMFLDAPNGAEITHQEHKPFTVAPGQYRREIVQEYDHFAEEARNVID